MPTTDEGGVYTLQRERITGRSQPVYFSLSDTPIVLNHYFSRSEEEFQAKLRKNRTHDNAQGRARKRKAIVAAIESNLVEDARIQKFVPRVLALRQKFVTQA